MFGNGNKYLSIYIYERAIYTTIKNKLEAITITYSAKGMRAINEGKKQIFGFSPDISRAENNYYDYVITGIFSMCNLQLRMVHLTTFKLII